MLSLLMDQALEFLLFSGINKTWVYAFCYFFQLRFKISTKKNELNRESDMHFILKK